MKKKLSILQLNLIISFTFLLLFCFKNRYDPLILNLCNSFFIVGIIYLCIALIIHVRNFGLFKSLSYYKYRRNKNSLKKQNFEQNNNNPLPENFKTFYDYMENKYSEQWNYKVFYVISIPFLALFLVFLFIYYK